MFLTIKNSRYMQYVAALTATLTMTSSATYLTWPSPTLPLLHEEGLITDEEGSWIASGFLLASIPFTFLAGWMMERFGRKYTLLFAVVPLAVPWIIIVFTKSALVICLARGLGGAGLAIASVVSPIYSAEIADSDIRGRLGTLFIIMKMGGNVLVLSIGPFVNYETLALVCLSIPIIFFIIFCFMPESPYYLVKIGKPEEAKNILIKTTSKQIDSVCIQKKIKEIEMTIENDMKNKSTLYEVFGNKEYRKILGIMLGVKSLQQLSGLAAVEPYMQTIIGLTDSSITPEVSSIIFGIVPIPAVLLTGIIVDRMGRKPILIISALGCAIALIGEGTYFYMQEYFDDVKNINWLPTTALVLFMFMNPFGIATLPYILTAEIFPTNIKSLGSSICVFYGLTIAFLLSKFFQPMIDSIGIYSTFWMFSGFCVAGAVFIFFVLPETKGKTFADIQVKLNRNVKKTQVEA